MEFVTFLAVPALVVSAFLMGFTVAGLHEREIDEPSTEDAGAAAPGIGARLLGPFVRIGVVLVATSLMLVDPSVIDPLWLQYLLLAGVPVVLGYVARRVLARRLETEAAEG